MRRHAKLNNQIPTEFVKACMEKLEQNAASLQDLPVHEIGSNSMRIGQEIKHVEWIETAG